MRKREKEIQRYQRLLPGTLMKRYGAAGPYTTGQVERTVSALGLSEHYLDFALFMFCDPASLDAAVFTDEAILEMSEIIHRAIDKASTPGAVAGILGFAVGGAFDSDSDCGDGGGGCSGD